MAGCAAPTCVECGEPEDNDDWICCECEQQVCEACIYYHECRNKERPDE